MNVTLTRLQKRRARTLTEFHQDVDREARDLAYKAAGDVFRAVLIFSLALLVISLIPGGAW